MPKKATTTTVLECYKRAAEAHQISAAAADAVTKAGFVEIERHWRLLACRFQAETHGDEAVEASHLTKRQLA
jgi:hypothetical protein